LRKRCLAVLLAAVLLSQTAGKAAGGGGSTADLAALAAALTALLAQYEIDVARRSSVWTNEKSLHETDVKELAFDVATYSLDHVGILDSNTVWNDYKSDVTGLYDNYLYKNPGRELSFGTGAPRSDFDERNPGYGSILGSAGVQTDYPSVYKKRVGDLRDYAKNVLAGNKQAAANLADSLDPSKDTKEITKIYDALFGLSAASPSSSTSSSIVSGGLGDIVNSVLGAVPTGIGDLNVTTYRAALQAANQADNYNNKAFSLLRADVMRQVEAETQFALYEQQERGGRVEAFERAVKSWTDVNPSGAAY
jgi:hypothetical protein